MFVSNYRHILESILSTSVLQKYYYSVDRDGTKRHCHGNMITSIVINIQNIDRTESVSGHSRVPPCFRANIISLCK